MIHRQLILISFGTHFQFWKEKFAAILPKPTALPLPLHPKNFHFNQIGKTPKICRGEKTKMREVTSEFARLIRTVKDVSII